MKKLAVVLCTLALPACTDVDLARAHLQREGYTSIKVGGWDGGECKNEDRTATHFGAVAPSGNLVEGTVCCRAHTCDVRVWNK